MTELRTASISARINRDAAFTKFQQAEVNLVRVKNSSRIEQVRIAKAQLNRAIAVTDQARREENRSAILYQEGAIS